MLTAKQVQNAKKGRHLDAKGLYLEVSPTGSKRWLLRYSRAGGRGVTEGCAGKRRVRQPCSGSREGFRLPQIAGVGACPHRSPPHVIWSSRE